MYFHGTIRPLTSIDVSSLKETIKNIPESAWEADWRKDANLNFSDSHTIWMRSMPFNHDNTFHIFDSSCTCQDSLFKEHYEKFHSQIEDLLDGTIVRTSIIRLLSNKSVKRHVDGSNKIFRFCRRLIIPIISGEKSKFIYDNIEYTLDEGMIYDTNPFIPHSTFNGEDYARYQAVIDLFPKEIPESVIKLEFHPWDEKKLYDLRFKIENRDRDKPLKIWQELLEEEKIFAMSADYLSKFL